jgi:hypothetical protein
MPDSVDVGHGSLVAGAEFSTKLAKEQPRHYFVDGVSTVIKWRQILLVGLHVRRIRSYSVEGRRLCKKSWTNQSLQQVNLRPSQMGALVLLYIMAEPRLLDCLQDYAPSDESCLVGS